MAQTQAVLERIPEGAPGIGLIGAALAFHKGLGELLEWAASSGRKAGVSSLRAERVDRECVELLKRTGSEVLTVALDGPSERVRAAIWKDVGEEDLVMCATLAREAGLHALKVYVMIGMPGEERCDVLELAALANRLNRILPVVLSVAVFVPKCGTPLESARFGPMARVSEHLQLLRRECSGGVRIGSVSPREAAIQCLVDHAGPEDGPKLVEVARRGASFSDYRSVFKDRMFFS